jgi:hypothetical protein
MVTRESNYDRNEKINLSADTDSTPPNGKSLPDGGYTTNTSASKLQTDCKVQQMNSLQCIQDHYETKDVACRTYFDLYNECRKQEHAAILEKNQQQASKSFW